jgi:hypothetical protein
MSVDYSKLSDAELEAVAAGDYSKLSDATLMSLAGEPSGDYKAEAARKGFAGSIATGLAAGGAALGAESAMQRAMARSMGVNIPETPLVNPAQAFAEIRKSVYDPLMSFLGSTGAKPQTGTEKIIGAGIESVTSPESYLFPGLSVARRMGLFGQAVTRPVEAAAIGGGAEAGAQAGRFAGQKMGAPTAGEIVGSFIGGGVGQSLVGFVPRLTPAAQALKTKLDSFSGRVPQDELTRDIDSRINNIFIAAAAADPKFASIIEEAVKAQKGVSIKTPGAEAVELPINAVLANNPVINNFIQGLSAKDPVFRANYSDQFERAKAALTLNQMRLFGDPSKAELSISVPKVEKPVERKIRSIDEQIADISKVEIVDPFTYGQKVSSLITKKEDDARALVRPLYQEAFDIAAKNKVELPAASVGDIYNFVASEKASDIFKTFPSIYSKVKSRFAPTEVETPVILGAKGEELTGGVKQMFAPAGVDDLDSLKREINRQLRKTNEPSEIRLLGTLKDKVNSTIESLDESFVAAYKNADKEYFKKVGLPFDSFTLQNVDRKKFNEQIAPAIIGNKSNVIDFINAVGDDGVRLVKDAYLDNFAKSSLRNEIINPQLANKWIEKNKGGMSLVPGLEDEIRAAVGDVQKLNDYKNRLNANFTKVAGDELLRLEGKSTQQLVNSMYGSKEFTDGFLRKYGGNKDNLNAIRSFMLDDIVSSGNPIEVLNDRNKSAIFNRVFGPTYSEKVKDFAVASDRLTRDITNVPFRGETVPKTPIEQMIGVPPETILSRFYNPVSGPVYAMSYIFSRFWAKQALEGTEQKLKDILLNPKDAMKVMSVVGSQAKSIDMKKVKEAADVMTRYGIDYVNAATRDFLTGGARGQVQQMQSEE